MCSAYKVTVESSAWEGAPLGSCSPLSRAVVMGELSSQLYTALICGAGLKQGLTGVSTQRHRMISRTAAMIWPGQHMLLGTLLAAGMRDQSTKRHTSLVPAYAFPRLPVPGIPMSCQGRLMWRPIFQLGPFPSPPMLMAHVVAQGSFPRHDGIAPITELVLGIGVCWRPAQGVWARVPVWA